MDTGLRIQRRGTQRGSFRFLLTVRLLPAVAVIATAAIAPPSQAVVDQRELRAREAFAVGRYQEALELFAKLYAEKPHPNYLRNIGRCYQNLGDADKAIITFKDYLRNGKGITPSERQEVEEFIKEMEDLQLKRQLEANAGASKGGGQSPSTVDNGGALAPLTSPPVSRGGNTGGPMVPVAVSPTAGSSDTPNLSLTAAPGSPAHADDTSAVYERWWFWAIIGGVVAAGLGTAAALGVFTTTEDAKCPTGVKC